MRICGWRGVLSEASWIALHGRSRNMCMSPVAYVEYDSRRACTTNGKARVVFVVARLGMYGM